MTHLQKRDCRALARIDDLRQAGKSLSIGVSRGGYEVELTISDVPRDYIVGFGNTLTDALDAAVELAASQKETEEVLEWLSA